jgi:diguanylate cyclase (GGDEF)-like protein
MTFRIVTHGDALRHTAGRVAMAVTLTVVLTWSMTLMQFGTDPDATVRAGFVTNSVIVIGIIVSALLTAGLSYRSALVMRELDSARAELMRISCTDQLTGLLNRRGFDDAAASALSMANKANLNTTVLMCDLDRFKTINDRFGHEFGDKVLVAVAAVLRLFAQETGALVARHGGEEFAALMVGVTQDQAARYAEDLRHACAAKEVCGEDVSTFVTISIGLAVCRGEIDLSKVMRTADQALYVAKHRGRNRVAKADAMTGSIAA